MSRQRLDEWAAGSGHTVTTAADSDLIAISRGQQDKAISRVNFLQGIGRGFAATIGASPTLSIGNSEVIVAGAAVAEEYDDDAAFTPSSGAFVVPRAGIYLVEFRTEGGTGTGTGNITLRAQAGVEVGDADFGSIAVRLVQVAGQPVYIGGLLTPLKLPAGAILSFSVTQSGLSNATIDTGRISAIKIG